MPSGEHLKGKGGVKFGDGQDPTKGGRKKKIYTILKEKGYSKDDIVSCFGEMAFYNLSELNEVVEDREKPAIMIVVARAFIRAIENGDWRYIKEIMEHTIGKPLQKTENKHEGIQFVVPSGNITDDIENDEIV